MAIRPTKQAWDAIRAEYLKGATAVELAQRYGSVKAASIHARAVRERWRELAMPSYVGANQYVAIHAKATGISIDEAAHLEAVDQNSTIAGHRAEIALLSGALKDGLTLASEAAKQGDAEMAKSAEALITSVRQAATALHVKISAAQLAYGLDSATSRCYPSIKSIDVAEDVAVQDKSELTGAPL